MFFFTPILKLLKGALKATKTQFILKSVDNFKQWTFVKSIPLILMQKLSAIKKQVRRTSGLNIDQKYDLRTIKIMLITYPLIYNFFSNKLSFHVQSKICKGIPYIFDSNFFLNKCCSKIILFFLVVKVAWF